MFTTKLDPIFSANRTVAANAPSGTTASDGADWPRADVLSLLQLLAMLTLPLLRMLIEQLYVRCKPTPRALPDQTMF